jgi:hypothetical protein
MAGETRFLAEFFDILASHGEQLEREIAGAWKDLAAVLESVRQSYDFIEFVEFPSGSLACAESLFREHAQPFLFAPLQNLEQRRPLARVLAAVQEFDASAGDEIGRLPRSVQLSGADLATALGMRAAAPMLTRWRGLHRSRRPVAIRECLADHVQRLISARAELDGAAMLLFAQAALHVAGLWQAFRRCVLASLAAGRAPELDLAEQRQWWMETLRRYNETAAQILARYAEWARIFPSFVARSLLRDPAPAPSGRRAKRADRMQKYLTFWARQHRAMHAILNLESRLCDLGRSASGEVAATLAAVDAERADLVSELDGAATWLQNWPQVNSPESFPPPGARLAAAEERCATLLRRMAAIAREQLPRTIETVQPRTGLPGIRKPWRELTPAKTFLEALDQLAAPVILDGLREAETAHRVLVRQIERAREVVSYGFETASATGNDSFAQQAVENARSLLAQQQGSLPETHAVVEHQAVRGAAAALLETYAALEKGRIGFFAYATGQRSRVALKLLAGVSAEALHVAIRESWSAGRRVSRRFLLRIGWVQPPPKPLASVVRRAQLSDMLEVEFRARELPMIYQRLFRLAPVEDVRFLVGREAELAGLAEAVRRWERGQGAAVLVIGARGSGKTSLLNCAVTSVFADREVISGSFCRRVTTCAEMDAFLRSVLRLPDSGDLIAALSHSRRIVVLEEFERTFLRVMNGLDAVRRLLDVMYATSKDTLWVFSVNEAAFRYLNVVIGLAEHFSHRINAMSVRQEDLTNAILQRHNLSGLRLAFAPLPPEDPRVSRLRRMLGFEQDPHKLFLDSVYAESEGIFRSAFELWQRCIERVEGGCVYMRQPLSPDYSPLYNELVLDDHFALKAVLQHGSLADDELSRVLGLELAAAQRQLERLRSLEILEPDGICPECASVRKPAVLSVRRSPAAICCKERACRTPS